MESSKHRKPAQGTAQTEKPLASLYSPQTIQAMSNAVSGGVILTDTQHRISLMNNVACKIFSTTAREAFGKLYSEIVSEKNLLVAIEKAITNLGDHYRSDFTLTGNRPNTTTLYKAEIMVLKDSESVFEGLFITLTDLNYARELNRLKTEFVSAAAHELRTPLTSIKGFSEILLTRENLAPEEQEKFLTHINRQADNLMQIINDLLDISHFEAGQSFYLNKQMCRVGDAIRMVTQPFIDKNPNHDFLIITPAEIIEVMLDKEKMAKVLTHLLDNSVKYSPDGGTIRVSGNLSNGEYHIGVEDEGIGMNPYQLDRIFDKFYRGDNSNKVTEGTGLGMNIVKNIVEAHGGRVHVESSVGRGTKVLLRIPCTNCS